MTIQDIYDALNEKFNVFFGEAPDGTKCPYLVFQEMTHPNVMADNRTYFKTTEFQLTMVEAQAHDFNLQKELEDILDGLDLPYTVDESWLPSENVIETYYTMAVYGGIVPVNEES